MNKNDKQRLFLVDGLPLLLEAKEKSEKTKAMWSTVYSTCMQELKKIERNKGVTDHTLHGRTVNHLIREAARKVFDFHPVFENISPNGRMDVDVGTGLRSECKGDEWTKALEKWLAATKEPEAVKNRISLGVDLLQVVLCSTTFSEIMNLH